MKSSNAMILAVMDAILAEEPEKPRTLMGFIPVRRSNHLSPKATDGSWSFVGSNFPVRNESMNKN